MALFGFSAASIVFYPAYQSIGALNNAAQTTPAVNSLNQQRSSIEAGGARGSLDEKIYSAVREQAGIKGLRYEADAAAY